MKKILVSLLAILCTIGLLVPSAFAAEYPTQLHQACQEQQPPISEKSGEKGNYFYYECTFGTVTSPEKKPYGTSWETACDALKGQTGNRCGVERNCWACFGVPKET